MESIKEKEELRERAAAYSDKLDDIVYGRIRKCPTCGEWVEVEDAEVEDDWGDLVEGYECPSCYYKTLKEDEFEGSLWLWLADHVLDMEYIISARGAFQAGRLYVGLGGPTVYIDTEKHCVIYHHGEEARCGLSTAAEEICEEFAENAFSWGVR
jgi:hypothetical protein